MLFIRLLADSAGSAAPEVRDNVIANRNETADALLLLIVAIPKMLLTLIG